MLQRGKCKIDCVANFSAFALCFVWLFVFSPLYIKCSCEFRLNTHYMKKKHKSNIFRLGHREYIIKPIAINNI